MGECGLSVTQRCVIDNVDVVVATIGISPGVVAELVGNLCRGRITGCQTRPITPREVVLVATEDANVLNAARAAFAILNCCLGACKPRRVRVEVVRGCQDVVDRACFRRVMQVVEQVASRAGTVLLDLTGGRASMAAAAALGAARLVLSGSRIIVTTTQLPAETARSLSTQFTRIVQNYNFEQIYNEFIQQRMDCNVLRKYQVLNPLCSLYTGRAVTGVLYP